MQLIDEVADALCAANGVLVRRQYLQGSSARPVRDGLDVTLHMHQVAELVILANHVARRREGIAGHLDRRRQDVEACRLPPVQDQRGHHDPGRQRRFAVLLRNQDKPLSDFSAARFGVVGPEDAGN